MSEISGTYHDGQIKLDGSVNWPNGSRVRVLPEASIAGEPTANGSSNECS